jgi:transcriptional regulator with XRE-family HTH domain
MTQAAAKDRPYVAKAIYRRMQEAGLNYRSLALKAGLPETYVRDVMYGRSKNPKHHALAAIATALNCSLLDIIDPKLANLPLKESEVVDKPEERAWLAFYRALSPDARTRMLVEMISNTREKRDDV